MSFRMREHITGQAFQSDNRYEIFPFSYRMEVYYEARKRDCPGPSCQDLGTEHAPLF